MNEWIQVEVGRRRIVRAAPDRKASQSPHSASFFLFPSPPSFTSFFFLPSPPPSMKGCYSSLLPWQPTSQRSLVLGDIMNEWMNKLKKKNCLFNIFKNFQSIILQHIFLPQFLHFLLQIILKINRLFCKNFVPKFSFHISFLKSFSNLRLQKFIQ